MKRRYTFRFKHVLGYARQKCQTDVDEGCKNSNNKIDS